MLNILPLHVRWISRTEARSNTDNSGVDRLLKNQAPDGSSQNTAYPLDTQGVTSGCPDDGKGSDLARTAGIGRCN
jgi:hypothetical protein